ncbi:MAG: RHS repeat-associated core domain-containing protein [Clostridiaceae bacterium]
MGFKSLGTVSGFRVNINPGIVLSVYWDYRYRGYWYDNETGLYYLHSRHYNPETCRILNADAAVGQVGNIEGHNMFQYCFNNRVPRIKHS